MLGDILRQEREKQNLTIKDIENGTSIRTLYISAIEEHNYDVLPGEVYLKGFIKTYANYLNLDGTEIVKLYHQEKNNAIPIAEPEVSIEKSVESSVETKKVEAPLERKRPPIRASATKIAMFAAVMIVVVGLGYWGFGLTSEEKDPLPATVTAKNTEPAPPPKQVAPAVLEAKKQTKAVEITAKYTGNCWTQINVDNKIVYEGIPKNGETLSWAGDNHIVVRAGNAGAVMIQYNGKDLGALGAAGDVITKKFTKDAAIATK